MKLIHVTINAEAMVAQEQQHYHLRDAEIKLTPEYQQLKRSERGPWLVRQLAQHRAELESWKGLCQLTNQVRQAVSIKAQAFNRLESQLRVHAKLFEAGIHAGATSPTSYTGDRIDPIDIH